MAKRFLCRLGLHEMEPVEHLITMGRERCIHCREEWITSLFGSFKVDPARTALENKQHD